MFLTNMNKIIKNMNIIVGGSSGTGIESVAKSLALSFSRDGLHVITTSEYQNLIRGGHSFSSVHISNKPVFCHQLHYEILLAMDKTTIEQHILEIDSGGAFIYDKDKVSLDGIKISENVNPIGIPMYAIAKEVGLALAANVVAVGALYAIMERNIESMKSVLKTLFEKKGNEVVEKNISALREGYNYVKKNIKHRVLFKVEGDKIQRSLISGNEAISLGCIKSGMKFLAAYPMTPGSTIMTTLASEAREYNIAVLHVEDEISAINMAIGAGYAGVRSATSTSGGGFALMSEAISLAGQMEVPVVIFNAQRPGPSTGLPTRTGQGDLRMVMHAGQGDFPRLVIAVGDHEDAVNLTSQAFHYADKYQIPVIVLTEKYLADSYKNVSLDIADSIKIDRKSIINPSEITEDFLRYKLEKNGISKRSIPGMKGGNYTATSYEHNEEGKSVEEVEEVSQMIEKRQIKLETLRKELPAPKVFGSSKIKLLIWGATKGPALEAQKILRNKHNIEIQIIQMQYIFPFASEKVKEILDNKEKLIIVEGNQSGQIEGVLKEYTGIIPDHSFRNYYGRPMTGEWIANKIFTTL